MATLKMMTNDGNYTWLTGVRRVETRYHFSQGDVPSNPGEFPWEYVKRVLDSKKPTKTSAPQNLGVQRLLGVIESDTVDFENRTSLLSLEGNPSLTLLYVVFEDAERRPENWLVWEQQNFLMDHGKTVDRI